MQENCRFLDFFYHLEVIELLHGLCFDVICYVDVWLHGLGKQSPDGGVRWISSVMVRSR